MTKYTVSQEKELRETGTHNLATATAFANKHGLSVRSVIPKIKALGLTYETKKTSTGDKGVAPGSRERNKAQIVASVQAILNLDLRSFGSMTNTDLQELEKRLLEVARG